jgi:Carboxypeptidase regulatory-like domain
MGKKPFLFAIAFSILLFAFSGFVFSQGTTSRVTGTVSDNAGASVSGATVTLTNEGTNVSLTTQTSDSGAYTFDLIQPGNYQVSVEKQGFKKFLTKQNAVLVNQPATINIALEIGDVSATVTVENSVEVVQTSTSGNVGTSVTQREIESLPIIGTRGRNPLDLLNYQPGVVNGANTGGGVHVNGSRDRAFNFTLDGIDINESSAGGSNFTPLRPNPDSIQEFQLVTSNFTAELGRSSGAQVTFVTRGGTNDFRGNLFEFYQTPRFNANEYENNLLRIPRRQFVQHIYGGSFGGPLFNPGFGEGTKPFSLLKDRAFFFVNMQFLRANETRLAQRTVYTDAARQGLFRFVVGGRNAPVGSPVTAANPLGPSVSANGSSLYPNCSATITTACVQTYNVNSNLPITVSTVDPTLSALLRNLPTPNDYSVGDGLNFAGYNFVAPQIEKQYDFVTRFDFKVADNNTFYVRYAQGEQNTFGDIGNGGLQSFPGFPNLVDTFRNPKNLAVNWRWSPTAKLANEFVVGVNLFGFSFNTGKPDPTIPYTFNTVTTPNTNFNYNARRVRTFQIVDNLTFDFSPHTIKTGINFRFNRQFDDRSSAGGQIEPLVGFGAGSSDFTGYNLPLTAGSLAINSADLTNLRSTINNLIGRISSITQGFVVSPSNLSQYAPAGTRWNFTAYYPEFDFYVQDSWKFRPNLTLDFGVRYEPKLNPRSKDLLILRPNQNFTSGSTPTNSLRWEEGNLFKNDLNNLSPSVGFAWDPFKNGKTSIRANYRLSYDRFPTQLFAANIYQSAPGNTTSASIPNPGTLIRNGLPNLTPTLTPNALRQPTAFSTSGITLIDPALRFPESHQWFFGVQRELGWKNVLEINYIGRRGTHLFGGYDSNQVNISARDSRCPENFLEAFNAVRASATANSCLINLLFTGDGTNNAGTATFRSIGTVSTALGLARDGGGGAAAAALAVSQRTTGTSQLIATTIGNPYFFQRFPQFTGNLNVLDSNDVSRYNGLEFILKRRAASGIGYQIAYTLSESKDTRSFDPTFTTVSRGTAQSASSTPFDVNNRRLNYAWSDFDRRHVLQATYIIELPFGKNHKFLSESAALDYIVGGWQLAGTLNLASGRPFTVYSGINTFSNVVSSTVSCGGCPRNFGSVVQETVSGVTTNYFFTAAQIAQFSPPNPGQIGETGRNYFIGPKQFQMDMSLLKKFKFNERYSFDLRVDARNITNTPSFSIPNANLTSTTSPFGRIRESVISSSRKIQFSGKFNF